MDDIAPGGILKIRYDFGWLFMSINGLFASLLGRVVAINVIVQIDSDIAIAFCGIGCSALERGVDPRNKPATFILTVFRHGQRIDMPVLGSTKQKKIVTALVHRGKSELRAIVRNGDL